MDQTNKEFWDAAAAGDFAKVCACVSKGANVNVSNGDGRTAFDAQRQARLRRYRSIPAG